MFYVISEMIFQANHLSMQKMVFPTNQRVTSFQIKNIPGLFCSFSRHMKFNRCTKFINTDCNCMFFSIYDIKIVWVMESIQCS